MIDSRESKQLEALTSTIHFQLLHEHGNRPDAAQQLALRAVHNQLVGMVTDGSSLRGRWCLSAPIGFGKSSAVAAFLSAAWQLGLLSQITVTIAAARVEQLYDFEDAILDAGIPANVIRQFVSVLHSDKNAKRASDDDQREAPVLLITHERIRRVYARPERETIDRKPVYFVKRDLVIWDERCLVTSPVSIPLSDLKQARAALKEVAKPRHQPLVEWLDQVVPLLVETSAALSEKFSSKGILPKAVGIEPKLPPADIDSFLANVHGAGHAQKTLQDFLSMMQFRLRLIPLKGHEALVSYFVVVPDHISNVLVLDASFKVSELSTRDVTIKSLEDHHPMLFELKQTYGKTLRDLIDCSDLAFTHWDVPTGKDSVVKALTDYNSSTAKGGNPVLELVEVVKARQATGQAVLIWTHKRSAGCHDIPRAVESALVKGGVDLSRQIVNPFSRSKELVPQVQVQNFGQHDATNKYSYCDVVVLFGVQRRQLGDISAAILGADRALGGKLRYKDAYSARAGEAAVVAQQAIGRGRSRITLNGKAGLQNTILFFAEDGDFNITARLKVVYPGATWTDYQPVYVKESETLVEKWSKVALSFLDGLPTDKAEIKSSDLKKAIGAQDVHSRAWSRIVDRVCERSNVDRSPEECLLMSQVHIQLTPWIREGYRLVRISAGACGFKDESAAA